MTDIAEFAFIPSPQGRPPAEFSIETDHLSSALRAVRGVIFETPLVPAHCLFGDVAWTHRTLVKLENLQRTGSFKLRGALARMSTLRAGGEGRGVVAAGGTHNALAVAFAARRFGLSATVVVPATLPKEVLEALAQQGAEVIAHAGDLASCEALAMDLARVRSALCVTSFDDPMVMAGNGGTLAAELAAMDNGRGPSEVIVPVGGGALAAGLRAGLNQLGMNAARITGAQPAEKAAMAVSFERNEPVAELDGESLAGSLRNGVSATSFALAARALYGIVLVPESEIEACLALARSAGLLIDPAAAVALAATRAMPVPEGGRRVLVLTGR